MHRLIFLLFISITLAACGESSSGLTAMETTVARAVITPSPSAEATVAAEATATLVASAPPPATVTPPPAATPLPSPTPPPAPNSGPTDGLIAPSDSQLRLIGRVDTSNPAAYRFDWSGIVIEGVFQGTSLTLLLDDGRNLYNVTIDDTPQLLATLPGQTEYLLASNLPDTRHPFRIEKRTEALVGRATFKGLKLDLGRGLTTPPAARQRRIEFIGDSITTGYGNEGQSATCNFSAQTENIALSYASLVANQFNADAMITAFSGLGVVRNFGFAETLSQGTMLPIFNQTLALEPGLLWEFERWTPDAVVVNLGTNDFSTNPQPDRDFFTQGYLNLLGGIRNRYPDAHIFAVAGPIMLDPATALIGSAVAQINDDRIHFVPLENTLIIPDDFGCDYHPNRAGHQKITDQLAPAMRQILGW